MSEPIVTIKFTETELQILNQIMEHHIEELENFDEVSPAKSNLQKELKKIETWITDEKHKAITDKKASEGSFKEQTQMETSQRICVPCDD